MKYIILPFIFFILILNNTYIISNTLNIFINNVFVSLFPFILFTEIVTKSNIRNINFLSKLFKLNNNSSIAIILRIFMWFPYWC
jgi:hypothetical protein